MKKTKNIKRILKEWGVRIRLDWIEISGSVLFHLWALVNMVMNFLVPVIGRRYVEHAKDYEISKGDGAQKIALFI